ncbi:putative Ig domain-containing protein [Shimia sp. Alg240-R146]|uniref:putative Ig domain-containing protein n=1 Tax=Shimia sp. Alg240-R146 TaxID=2993449 RepID=UPI0022E56B0A|nr:putative Ig domain-containing protein [Shimia sp. Alg240-R146]
MTRFFVVWALVVGLFLASIGAVAAEEPPNNDVASFDTAIVGVPFEQQVLRSSVSGERTVTVVEGSLPSGLTLETDGTLRGTPSARGEFEWVVLVKDPGAAPVRKRFRMSTRGVFDRPPEPNSVFDVLFAGSILTALGLNAEDGALNAPGPVGRLVDTSKKETDNGFEIETKLDDVQGGRAYSYLIDVDGRTPPYSFEMTGGELPTGLSLSSDGLVSGTSCDRSGNYKFDIRIVDADGEVGEFEGNKDLSIKMKDGGEDCDVEFYLLLPLQLPEGFYGEFYSRLFFILGDSNDYFYELSSGVLPQGMSMQSWGQLRGTPEETGTFPIVVTAWKDDDRDEAVAVRSYDLVIVGNEGLDLLPESLPDGDFGVGYSETLTAQNGDGNYTFSIESGQLPDGVSLSSSGQISGVPNETGSFSVTFHVEDGQSNEGGRGYSFDILPQSDLLAIVPTTLADGTFDQFYSEALTASGGEGPYEFATVSGALPDGVVLETDGTLSGIPDETGTFSFAVEVADVHGNDGRQEYNLVVDPVDGLIELLPETIPGASYGVSYSVTLSTEGGVAPYTGTMSGDLPQGITFDSPTGKISGIPEETGTFDFSVTVTDVHGNTGTRSYQLVVAPIDSLEISPEGLNNADWGVPYSALLTADGGDGSYEFTLSTGALPAGISLALDGTISGTPTETGAFNFEVAVEDGQGNTGDRTFVLVVDTIDTLTIAPATLGQATFGQSYSQLLTASGGDGVYEFVLSSGALPAGMTLSSDGTLSGTPLETGTFDLEVLVTDSNNNTGVVSYSWLVVSVEDLFDLTPPVLPQGTYGVSYSVVIDTTGGLAPFTGVISGDLPAGLTFDTGNGRISGIPAENGDFPVSVVVTDGQGNTGTQDYVLQIVPIATLSIAPPALGSTGFGDPFSAEFTASGGAGGYQFAIVSGGLPAGLILTPAGDLSGTPTETGNFEWTLVVEDSAGNTGTRNYSLIVDPIDTLSIQPSFLDNVAYADPISVTLTADGGDGNYRFAVASGVLPVGATLASDGSLTGAPLQTGDFDFRVAVDDGQSNTGQIDYTLTVNPNLGSLEISPDTLEEGEYGSAYTASFGASGGDDPYIFFLNGALPAGLSFGGGTISGTPTEVGSFPLTVTAEDSQGNTGTRDYVLVINTKSNLEISPADLPVGEFGASYSQLLSASGGDGAYTFSVESGALPEGVTLSAAGNLSGIPLQTGTFYFDVAVTDTIGSTGSRGYALRINAITTLDIAPPSLPNGAFGSAYAQKLAVTGGDGNYLFSVSGGTLPQGISLTSSGELSGTPAAVGTFNFTIDVVDGEGNTGTRSYSLQIEAVAGLLELAPTTLPAAIYNAPYAVSVQVSGGLGPYSGTLTGTLPAGMTFDPATLQFSGTPIETGNFPLTVDVSDSQSNTGSIDYTLAVDPITNLPITPSTLTNGTFGTPYAETLNSSGGDGSYSFTVQSGSLPAGLSLGLDGALSGTPTRAGQYNFSVQVIDGQLNTGMQPYTLEIETIDTLSIAPASLVSGRYGTAYSETLVASGGDGSYSFALTSGPLPAGITLSADGAFSGTPLETGSFPISVAVADSGGNSGDASYTLVIDPAVGLVAIAPAVMPDSTFGQSYSLSLSFSGGDEPYTPAVVGALPTGITFDTALARFTGTPIQTGTFPLTVNVVDQWGNSGTIAYSLDVASVTDLVILPDDLNDGQYGVSYSETLTATGGDGSYGFAVTSGALPAGVTLSTGGLLQGTPTQTGDFNFVIQVTDGQGNTGDGTYSIKIATIDTLAISPTTATGGTYGAVYSQTFSATGGDGSYSFAVLSGDLPSGVTMSSTGVASGTPLETGVFGFDLSVQDSSGNTGTQTVSLTVAPVTTLVVQPATVSDGTFGVAYSSALSASGGDGNYSFAVSAGLLPQGMTLAAGGLLSGTPTQTGPFNFDVTATDGQGNTGVRSYTMSVNTITSLAISPDSLPNAIYGAAYNQTLQASGGNGRYRFALNSGALPAGVSLSPSGLIAGTPTETGDFSFVVLTMDGEFNTGTKSYTITVDPVATLTISPTTIPGATYGMAYSQNLAATGGDGSYNFALAAGPLPSGMTLAANGTLSGTPVETGSFAITVSVEDGQGNTGSQGYTLAVVASFGIINITPAALADGVSGQVYSAFLNAAGGDGNYTGAISVGALPAGLTFDPIALSITGIPSGLPGTANFTVEVVDGQGNTGEIDYALTIAPAFGSLSIDPDTLGNGDYGAVYTQVFSTSDGTGPYTFSRASGVLPTGVTLAADGTLTGTPTETGNFNFVVEVVDSLLATGTASYTLTIVPVTTLVVSPTLLGDGIYGVAYADLFTATGGDGSNNFVETSGNLPNGMQVQSSGAIDGIPSETGTFNLTVTVEDGQGNTGSASMPLAINPVVDLFSLTPTTLPNATYAASYEVTIDTTGGVAPFTGALTGSLPSGVTFNTTNGKISGVPTEVGSFPVNIVVTDVHGNTGSRGYTLVVNPIENLQISPDAVADGVYGTNYTETFGAAGGAGGYGFVVSSGSLPTGVTLAAGGELSGAPTETGEFNFTVTVTDSETNTGTKSYALTVAPADVIAITPTAVPGGSFAVAYSQVLTATGGSGGYTFQRSSGDLPNGVTLAANGTLAGTPSETGSFDFVVGVTDSENNTGSQSYTLAIDPVDGLFDLTPSSLSQATYGQSYSVTIDTTGGVAPFVGQVAGALPVGVSFDTTTGKISGIPTETGDFPITVTVTDVHGNTGQRDYTLTVLPVNNLEISPASLSDGVYGEAYSETLTASGGDGTYQFDVLAGSLPLGLTLTAQGVLSGTPTETGAFNFLVRVQDGQTNTGTRLYALQIDTISSLTVLPATLPDGDYGVAYAEALTASGGDGNYSFSISSGALPDGLSLASNGALSGAPTVTGIFNFTVAVEDGQANTGGLVYTIEIRAVSGLLTIAPSTLADGQFGTTYIGLFIATGGDGAYSYTLTGDLPAGMAFDGATGLLGGDPQETGSFEFEIGAQDGQSNTGQRSYSWTVAPITTLNITPSALTDGVFGTPYTQTLTASGGVPAYEFSVTEGVLPDGLSLSASGELSGTPIETGSFNFEVTVIDEQSNIGKQNFSFAIQSLTNLAIAPASLPAVDFGASYSQTLTASGGDGTYEFYVISGSLPAGITLSVAGGLSGTPSQTGSFAFQVSVVDGQNNSGTIGYTLVVNPVSGLIEVIPADLPTGSFGTAYVALIQGSGGVEPYTSVMTGTLPSGLVFDAAASGISGRISGIPIETGQFPVSVVVTDAEGNSGTRSYTLDIQTIDTLEISPASLSPVTYGTGFTQTLTATGGAGGYEFHAVSGSLPSGVVLALDGTLSGTPAETGTFEFSVQVTDTQANSGTRSYSLRVDPDTDLEILPNTLPNGSYGAAYSQALSATGGDGNYVFAKASGDLPAGVGLAIDGSLSGTPLETGVFSFDAFVQDGQGNEGTQALTLTVLPQVGLVDITPVSIPEGTFGQAYSVQFFNDGGAAPYTMTLTGTLPNGIGYVARSATPAGELTGLPTETGSFPFTLNVTDDEGNTGSHSYTLIINEVTDLVIQPSDLADGVFGDAYSQNLSATGGDGNYTFSLTSGDLPDGLALAAGGALTGVPTRNGDFNFSVSAQDGQGNTGQRTYSVRITARTDLSITPTSLPDGTYANSYSVSLNTTGGAGSYVYGVSSGNLPSGLTLSPGGEISGLPLEAGPFPFDVQVFDEEGNSGTQNFTLVILPVENGLPITPSTLPTARYGSFYSVVLSTGFGVAPYTFEVQDVVAASADRVFQDGLSRNIGSLSDGDEVFFGIPVLTGSFQLVARVTDSVGNTGSQSYTLVVEPVDDLDVSPDDLPAGAYGSPFSLKFETAGGDGNYSYSLGTGDLPTGVSLQSDGELAGTPTETGDFNIRIDVIDGQSNTGSQQVVVRILPAAVLTISPETLSDGTYGSLYAASLSASGGDGNYSFSVGSGDLPLGLDLASDGTLTGTPEDTGSFEFTADVIDGSGNTGSRDYVLLIASVDGLLTISPAALTEGTYGEPYSEVLTASGGNGNYTFTLSAGALPDGIDLTSAGVLQGAPLETGTFAVTVAVVDSVGNTGVASYSLEIDPALGILDISPDVLPSGSKFEEYSQQLSADGGSGVYQFTLESGVLPTGLTLGAEGLLSGTPENDGDFNISIGVIDSEGNTGLINYSFVIEDRRPDPTTDPDIADLIEKQFGMSMRISDGFSRNILRRTETLHYKLNCLGFEDNCNDLGVWIEGEYTEADDETQSSHSFGIDFKINDNLFAGVAYSHAAAAARIGSLGTYSEADAHSLAGYFSLKFQDTFYLDGTIGHGELRYSDTRVDATTGITEFSNRSGNNSFLSMKLSGDYTLESQTILSPYLRYDWRRTNLDSYQEGGAGPFALGYSQSDQTVQRLAVGLKMRRIIVRPWGSMIGEIQAEIGHDYRGGYQQGIYYLDDPATVYTLRQKRTDSTRGAIGVGLDVRRGNAQFDFDLFVTQTTADPSPTVTLAVGASIEF